MTIPKYGSGILYSPDRVFLLGDVHNEADKLMSVLDKLSPQITTNDHVVFCGDLVDRGSEAALTIETLVDFSTRYPTQVFYVEGNHDWMLRNYLSTGSTGWMQYLKPTLDNLAAKWGLPDILPATIANALLAHGFKEITSRTIPYYETDRLIATHAPLDKIIVSMNGGKNYEQDYADWVADPILNIKPQPLLDRMLPELKWQFSDENTDVPWVKKFLVCGHQAAHHSSPRITKYRAFIDTGCGLRPKGKLTCLEYPAKKWFQND
jgi:predicted phosphodiesterase